MSRLQTALHAYPPGTTVTKEMQSTDRELKAKLDEARNAEIEQARKLQSETGCTWSDAIESTITP